MGIEIAEQVPASRKLGEERARLLIQGAAKVHVAKGKKLEVFDGGTADEGTSRRCSAPPGISGRPPSWQATSC